MADISRETYERSGIEAIVDNDGLLWLKEKHVKGGLDHKNLQEITIKYHYDHKKHRYELDNNEKKTKKKPIVIEFLETKN